MDKRKPNRRRSRRTTATPATLLQDNPADKGTAECTFTDKKTAVSAQDSRLWSTGSGRPQSALSLLKSALPALTRLTLPEATPSTSALPVSDQPMSAMPASTASMSAVPASTESLSALPVSIQSMSALPISAPPIPAIPVSAQQMSPLPVSVQSMSALTPSKSASPSSALPVFTESNSALPASAQSLSAFPSSGQPKLSAFPSCALPKVSASPTHRLLLQSPEEMRSTQTPLKLDLSGLGLTKSESSLCADLPGCSPVAEEDSFTPLKTSRRREVEIDPELFTPLFTPNADGQLTGEGLTPLSSSQGEKHFGVKCFTPLTLPHKVDSIKAPDPLLERASADNLSQALLSPVESISSKLALFAKVGESPLRQSSFDNSTSKRKLDWLSMIDGNSREDLLNPSQQDNRGEAKVCDDRETILAQVVDHKQNSSLSQKLQMSSGPGDASLGAGSTTTAGEVLTSAMDGFNDPLPDSGVSALTDSYVTFRCRGKAKKQRRRSAFGAELKMDINPCVEEPPNDCESASSSLALTSKTDIIESTGNQIEEKVSEETNTSTALFTSIVEVNKNSISADMSEDCVQNSDPLPRPKKRKRRTSADQSILMAGLQEELVDADDDFDLDKATDKVRPRRQRRSSLRLYRQQSQKLAPAMEEEDIDPEEKPCESVKLEKDSVSSQPSSVPSPNGSPDDSPVPEELSKLYRNKNYTKPVDKRWETIFESPSKGKLTSKQKLRRYLQFEDDVPITKLKKRRKRALENGWSVLKFKPVDEEELDLRLKSLDEEITSNDI